MRTNLDSDPRVLNLAELLGVPCLHVVGMLWKIWSWADSHSLDGNALIVTEVTLDRFVDRAGFAVALRKVGWLEGRDGALTFPRFAEHNGQTAKQRALTANRVAKHKAQKGNAASVTESLPEKRRIEKKDSDKSESNRTCRFVKPTYEEVEAYCRERNNGVNPQSFMAYYDSNGWRVGKNPMKDWKASVRYWERNGSQSKPSGLSVAAKDLAI